MTRYRPGHVLLVLTATRGSDGAASTLSLDGFSKQAVLGTESRCNVRPVTSSDAVYARFRTYITYERRMFVCAWKYLHATVSLQSELTRTHHV
jgi:hypothetical protein